MEGYNVEKQGQVKICRTDYLSFETLRNNARSIDSIETLYAQGTILEGTFRPHAFILIPVSFPAGILGTL